MSVPATYIAANGNLVTDIAGAMGSTPTAAQTAALGYVLKADGSIFMNGGSWLCSP
jgi:hypothetical protein